MNYENKASEILKRLIQLRKYQQFFRLNNWVIDYYILLTLNNNVVVKFKDLASMLMESDSALSQNLRKLEDREFISMIQGRDKRTRKINITIKGKQHLATLEKLKLIG